MLPPYLILFWRKSKVNCLPLLCLHIVIYRAPKNCQSPTPLLFKWILMTLCISVSRRVLKQVPQDLMFFISVKDITSSLTSSWAISTGTRGSLPFVIQLATGELNVLSNQWILISCRNPLLVFNEMVYKEDTNAVHVFFISAIDSPDAYSHILPLVHFKINLVHLGWECKHLFLLLYSLKMCFYIYYFTRKVTY